MKKRVCYFALALLVFACESKPPPPEAVESEKPKVPSARFGNQPKFGWDASMAGPSPSGSSSGADFGERAAGLGMAAEAQKGCSDKKCVWDACTKLCAAWVDKNVPPSPGDARTKINLNCIGSCLTERDQ